MYRCRCDPLVYKTVVSVLLQVILKEREEKKRHQLIDETLPLQSPCDDQATTGGQSSSMPERAGTYATVYEDQLCCC